MYGPAATAENDFGYDWHPKILGDHSHIATFAAMADGKVKGMCCVGQNPATSLNGAATRLAMRQLDWLVVKDNWLTETATHWYLGPEVKSGEVKIADIKTEIFFFPSMQIAEYDGSFTNTQRMLQWHHKASDAPGDCRTDTWFYHNLAKRMKRLYAGSKLPRDQGWSNVTWEFDPEPGVKPIYPGEPDAKTRKRVPKGRWGGYAVPDFGATKAPDAQPKPDGIGLDALSGTQPFIMRADGKGWLFVPAGLVDGPLPTHYEPHESPIQNPLYKQQTSPVHKVWASGKPYNKLAAVGDPKFPYVISTYRLTEHYLAGAMSRWLPWRAQPQAERVIELGPDLAKEKGVKNLQWGIVSSPRGPIR